MELSDLNHQRNVYEYINTNTDMATSYRNHQWHIHQHNDMERSKFHY